MEKTLIIDNKEVKFKSTAATPLRYKAQFHRDFLKDIMKMGKKNNNKRNKKNNKVNTKQKQDINIDIEDIDFEVLYNIIWILAKTADKSIPDPIAWYDRFEEFDFEDVFIELQDLILQSISSNSKKK